MDSRKSGNIPLASIPSTILEETFLSTVLAASLTVSVADLREMKEVEKARRASIELLGATRRVVLVRNDILELSCFVCLEWCWVKR